ncbi:MAG TPA: type II CAAX endopeptidase family protein [Longimicrobiaceae bacterium]|nr:type II CAAX endopeptidase family protein [Longimicrobiaceae bacterium]
MNRKPRWSALRSVAGPLLAVLLWTVVGANAVFLLLLAGYPVAGLLAGALLLAWFLRAYLLRAGRPGELRRRAELRMRPLGRDALLATLAAVPVLFALSWALGEVWTRLVPVPPETFTPFESLTRTPEGRLTVVLFAVVAAPLVEELVFRGLVQGRLERRWGPARALAFTSVVFAVFHALPWVLPIHVMLGLVFGWAVYATRSIWAGVLLHAANNSLAALGIGAGPPEIPPTVWRTGPTAELWTALAVLAVSALLWLRVARAMRAAGRSRRG